VKSLYSRPMYNIKLTRFQWDNDPVNDTDDYSDYENDLDEDDSGEGFGNYSYAVEW